MPITLTESQSIRSLLFWRRLSKRMKLFMCNTIIFSYFVLIRPRKINNLILNLKHSVLQLCNIKKLYLNECENIGNISYINILLQIFKVIFF